MAGGRVLVLLPNGNDPRRGPEIERRLGSGGQNDSFGVCGEEASKAAQIY